MLDKIKNRSADHIGEKNTRNENMGNEDQPHRRNKMR